MHGMMPAPPPPPDLVGVGVGQIVHPSSSIAEGVPQGSVVPQGDGAVPQGSMVPPCPEDGGRITHGAQSCSAPARETSSEDATPSSSLERGPLGHHHHHHHHHPGISTHGSGLSGSGFSAGTLSCHHSSSLSLPQSSAHHSSSPFSMDFILREKPVVMSSSLSSGDNVTLSGCVASTLATTGPEGGEQYSIRVII